MKKEKNIIMKKRRWYNKLFLLFEDKLKENMDYSIELRNRLLLSRFIYEQKFKLFWIVSPLIILIVIFIYFYINPSDQILFSLNFFDAAGVILTYFGTTFLAIVVWHNTWLQKREKENEKAVYIHTEIRINNQTGYCLFQENDVTKISISITNQNNCTPIKIDFCKVFEYYNESVCPIEPCLISFESDSNLLSYNDTKNFCIGFKVESFILPKQLYFCFKISNLYGHQVYCIVDCPIDKYGWCSEIYKNGTLIKVNKFCELKEKFGYDFLTKIVWYSPVGWKKKNINRIYLYKTKRIK